MAHRRLGGYQRWLAACSDWRAEYLAGTVASMEQARVVVERVRQVFSSRLLGAYLHGSAAAGGLRPASDLDLLFVTALPMSAASRELVVAELLSLSVRDGARPVEATFLVQGQVRPWHYPPTVDLQFGEWMRDRIERKGPPPPQILPDVAIAVRTVRAAAMVVFGPPPEDLLDAVPDRDVTHACLHGVPALMEDLATDTRNVLLTLARIWVTLATGEIRSKDSAAEWVLPRLDRRHRKVLNHARHLYLTCSYQEEDWPDDVRRSVPDCGAALQRAIQIAADAS